ncbi:MAG: class I SAM-dependent RNA methyltransferase [Acidobacteriota bacterium]
MHLDIVSVAGGGRGVGRAEGQVWFVAGALPGERVEVAAERKRAGIVEARALAVTNPSPWRDPEPCPVAGECGGCDLAHVRRESAGDVLREVVAGALRHAPLLLAETVRTAPVEISPMGWRLRARLHWDPAARRLGFRGPRSHRVVGIAPCRVVSPLLLGVLPELERALAGARLGAGEVEWLESLDASRAVASWRGGGDPPHVSVPGLAGWRRLDEQGVSGSGWGSNGVVMDLPVPLFVPVGAFFQGNRFLVRRLFDRIAGLASSSGCARVVDLYGGVGLLAAAAHAGGAVDLTVVEAQPVAAAAARRNLAGRRVVTGPAEAFLVAPGPGEGTLAILDPPRGGLSELARARLLEWRPTEIIVLACDPGRFGRDAGMFLEAYRLQSLEIWDLFAGSHHAEILAVLRR